MVSQVLFGQHFKILENKPKWVRIQLADDNYEGWICAKQYEEITYEDYDNLKLNDFPKIGDKLSYLEKTNTGERNPIPIGSTLPHYHKNELRIRQKEIQIQRRNSEVQFKRYWITCSKLYKHSVFMGWEKYFRY